MWIQDITSQLNRKGTPNRYAFNPSLLHIRGNLYLVAYRIASYLLPINVHPWKVWDDCYKMFDDGKSVAMLKYRSKLGGAFTRRMIDCDLNQRFSEYDSTGVGIVVLEEGKFKVVCNVPDFFGDEMNQDARLVDCEGQITIIYNVFENYGGPEGPKAGVKLRCRDLTVNMKDDMIVSISASRERYLFDHRYRSSEKHCSYGATRNIIEYGIGESFEQIIDGKLKKTRNTAFNRFRKNYGSNVLFSLSTQTLPFRGSRIGCGHAKFLYRSLDLNIARGDWKKHGKYIYTMFLYEYSGDKVLRVSPPFIPSENSSHLPYLLVMPISMIKVGDVFAITYGEGDCRAKVLTLNPREVEELLSNQSTEVSFLTKSCRVAHIGYFGSRNCGDDAFETVFKWIYRNTPHVPAFYPKYKSAKPSDLYVLGGGDVINEYFVRDVIKPSIAVGVGIPYVGQSHLLKEFSSIYLRNPQDAKKYGTNYIPDLAFLLSEVWPNEPRTSKIKTIGICPTRTFWNKKDSTPYVEYCRGMRQVISFLLSEKYNVVIIPFCTPKKNPPEDDILMAKDIYVKGCTIASIGDDNVYDTYSQISKLDFCICTRFHSHIFSTACRVPFVSLSCSRKCVEYMKDLPGCLYRLKTNEIDVPVDFNPDHFIDFIKTKLKNAQKIRDDVGVLRERNVALIRKFVEAYLKLVSRYATRMVLWMKEYEPIPHSPPIHEERDLSLKKNRPNDQESMEPTSSNSETKNDGIKFQYSSVTSARENYTVLSGNESESHQVYPVPIQTVQPASLPPQSIPVYLIPASCLPVAPSQPLPVYAVPSYTSAIPSQPLPTYSVPQPLPTYSVPHSYTSAIPSQYLPMYSVPTQVNPGATIQVAVPLQPPTQPLPFCPPTSYSVPLPASTVYSYATPITQSYASPAVGIGYGFSYFNAQAASFERAPNQGQQDPSDRGLNPTSPPL